MAGWIFASVVLYAAVLGLELHWNFFDWLPRLDLIACGLMMAALLALTVFGLLARSPRDRVVRVVALVLCLALLGLGVYVLPAEAKGEGLFARQMPSPWWYRGGRLLVMCCPLILWVSATFRLRAKDARTNLD